MIKLRISKKPEERKQEILAMAAKLFIEKGYYNTSVEDIANEIGIVKGTCYRYFPTKQELFCAALESSGQEFVAEIGSILTDRSKSVKERLRKAIHSCESEFNKMQYPVSDFSSEKNLNRQTLDIMRLTNYYSLAEKMKEFLKDGCLDGVFRIENIDAKAYAIVFSIFGITSGHFEIDVIMRELRFCLAGLLGIDIENWLKEKNDEELTDSSRASGIEADSTSNKRNDY